MLKVDNNSNDEIFGQEQNGRNQISLHQEIANIRHQLVTLQLQIAHQQTN
jgi:hypothetical protein